MLDVLGNAQAMSARLLEERDNVAFSLVVAAVTLSAICRCAGPHCVGCGAACDCPVDVSAEGWLGWLKERT